ncbi:LOW QUALITY PROTEIN: uncharacterized protein C2orf81 homolog [Phascolarctos cinereus]|uniref:LOW QUALITY PROTEIN: uncharacterized protein C2orf81 homolog n=1 Tax=Phascolarctos cinereus TaxID=38626 RepID=A0A6P5LRG3_PHACI|nr:LOW QUALITY PROTEIN: uncharacterized protein C2orf81 homolog [Phascolarctos cinereus]
MAHEGSRAGRDRGQARAKAEKVRPPTVPVPQIEIVPGRLNESEWISLMGIEEGEDVVGDVLAELLARVMDAAFKVYLTHQCIPFTISQAREAMLQITEWRFLARDEGETDVAEDPTWGEDEEPRASTTDTWAQGSVPVLHAPSPAVPPGLEPSSQPEGAESGEQLPVHQKTWISVPEDESLSFWEPPELRPTPGPPPTPEPSSQSPQHFALSHPCPNSVPLLSSFPSLDPSIWESSQFSLEMGSLVSPHPSLDMSIWASPQASLTSQPGYIPSLSRSPQPPFHCTGGGDSSSQVEETGVPSPYYLSVPLPPFLASPPWGLPRAQPVPAPKTSLTPSLLPAASAKFVRLQGGRPYLASGLAYDKMGQIVAMDPPDPTHVPQHQIHPLAKVVVPEAEVHPMESYREQRKHVKYGSELRFQLPGRPTAHFHRGFPFPAPGFELPLRNQPFTPLKWWSSVQWPCGLEGETGLLQRQPGGSSLIPGTGSGQMPRSDLSMLPHHGPRVLEATSQLIWKPSQLLDSMKLKPHVSLWNPSKNMHRSGCIPSHIERGQTPGPLPKEPSEQQPIQTHALTPQVTVAQLLKGSPPKVRALPSQNTVSNTLPEES